MQFFDTHCHVHDPEYAAKYDKPVQQIVDDARAAGVTSFISVGTSAESSRLAVEFAEKQVTHASIALHPHEVSQKSPEAVEKEFLEIEKLAATGNSRIVAIGECGLDYYYHKESTVQSAQQTLFRKHLDLATAHQLPLIFHIRDAFDDFFRIIDEYNRNGHQVRGVVHSFSAGLSEMEGCLERGFYLGLNGIMTFTKNEEQLKAAKAIPQGRIVLETDAPFLTPNPFRGMMCEMKHVVETAKFLSKLRNEPLEDFAVTTTANAKTLFRLWKHF